MPAWNFAKKLLNVPSCDVRVPHSDNACKISSALLSCGAKWIWLSQENLRALQARDAKKRLEEDEEELQERHEILAQGLNPDEELTRRKRIRQFEKDKE